MIAGMCSMHLCCGDDEQAVGNLLAVLNGDGGHYQKEHGTAKAAANAEARYHILRQSVAELPCYVARPGEGTYECRVDNLCPACTLHSS